MMSLTPDIQAWIHDVFVWGGGIDPSDAKRPSGYEQMYNFHAPAGKAAAETIVQEMLSRSFDKYGKVNDALATLSKFWWNPDLRSSSNERKDCIHRSADELGEYLAVFAKEMKIYWNDHKASKAEVDLFKKTILGQKLWEYGCFASQANGAAQPQAAAPSPAPAPTQAPAAGATKNPAKPPINNYKSSGPQSQNARGLLSTPHVKEYPTGVTIRGTKKMFDVEYEPSGKNTPYLFVAPLEKKGDAGNNVNKVLEGSGNGYMDCALFFDNSADADAFMLAYVKQHNLTLSHNAKGEMTWDSAKYKGLHVAQSNYSSNGYFKVNTEFGPAFIKANKLNEGAAVNEDLEEPEDYGAEREGQGEYATLTEEQLKELREKSEKEHNAMKEFFADYVHYDLHR